MSILSVENISPIGSGTSVTINNAATLVVNNVNSTGVVTATSFVGSGTLLLGTTAASNAESFSIHTSDSGKAIIKLTNSTTGTGSGDGFEFGLNANEQIEFVNKENTDMFFATNNIERLRIDSNGSVFAGGTVLSASDLNWTHNTYQRPHIFSGITGGNPSDGAITLASPETNPSNTRIGTLAFGCKTSSTAGVSNSGLKGFISVNTNTNVSDAWKTGAYMTFATREDNGTLEEQLRITSDGDLVIGTTTNSGGNRLYVVDSFTDAFVNPTDSILRIENANTSGTTGQASISFTSKTSGSNADSAIVSQAEDASGNARLEFWTDTSNGMSEKMTITSQGYVTKPTNLCLQYTANASTDITSGTIIYNTLVFDVNSSGAYNTSTGVFTAPVAGVYLIYHEFYAHTNSKAMTEIQKSTNGGGSFSPIKYTPRVSGDDSDYDANGCSFIAQLNANDQIKIIRREGTIHINNTYTHFHVQLIQ
tara:strand:- start:79 stop:1515 length:1437 start_codon:yes stop_codon:yes gene_type:complete